MFMRKTKSTNRFTKILLILVLICGALYIFRGAVYRSIITYKEDGNRKNYKVKDKNLAIFIEDNIESNQEGDIESIVYLSQEITSTALSYSEDAKESDPNKTVLLHKANPEGYAAFAASTGNYLIDKYKLSEVWEAKPVKGKLYIFGKDMYSQLKKKSFKEYDFVIFRNKITKREITVDPSLYARSGIERISKL